VLEKILSGSSRFNDIRRCAADVLVAYSCVSTPRGRSDVE
jgi:hypothetical protein